MLATGYRLATIAAISASPASAQQILTASPRASAQPIDYMGNARRFAGRRSVEDCRAEAAASGDIVVCGRVESQSLPVPEVYGPVAGSTDGAAVDPRGPPCGSSLSGHCYTGVSLPALVGAAVGVIGLILDPDKNLGEGTPIPERFRGANR